MLVLLQVELRKVKTDEKLKRLRNVGDDSGGDAVSGPDVQLDVRHQKIRQALEREKKLPANEKD